MNRTIGAAVAIAVLFLLCLAAGGLALRYKAQSTAYLDRCEQLSANVAALQARAARTPASAAAASWALPPPTPTPTANSTPPEDDDPRTRIENLRAQLAEKDRIIAHLQSQPAPPEPVRDRSNWLEELKTSDPERYRDIQNRREESRQRMREAFAQKTSFFLDRDTASMTTEEAAHYKAMSRLLDETWALAESLRADPPPENRRELRHTLRENMRTLSPMLDAERDKEFFQLGLDFGYTPTEASSFVEYLNAVIDVTSLSPIQRDLRGGWGGPPPDRQPPR